MESETFSGRMGSLMRSFSSSSSSGSSRSKKQRDGGTSGGDDDAGSDVFLNVYDLSPMNDYAYWFGFGIYHSGIEVHGKEYNFGAHNSPSSGVFEVEPKCCPGFIFRRSLWLGTTSMSRSEFRDFIEQLSEKYHGNSYHLIAKNCNHFTNDVCMHLTGKPIPGWVNRLARIGSLFNCFLPESIQITAVRHQPDHLTPSDDGSDLIASEIGESDDEDMHHYLLTLNNDVTLPRTVHMKPVAELS